MLGAGLLRLIKKARVEQVGKALVRWEESHVLVGHRGNTPVYRKIFDTQKGAELKKLRRAQVERALKNSNNKWLGGTVVNPEILVDLW